MSGVICVFYTLPCIKISNTVYGSIVFATSDIIPINSQPSSFLSGYLVNIVVGEFVLLISSQFKAIAYFLPRLCIELYPRMSH